ncbi:hypothetical protein [uncultured Psychroserpens sp.]|uniref:hypothetical protein n=1 Tax=uncultured Psychroserpens sp. TaxID=255436 RepID=UPI00260C4F34|nr:hypothetical protein [uncultured Psychroserpens sp.]
MNEHNTKAQFFCHTHPNLFLQKRCKGCRRGMCHTCINQHNDYCSSCLRQSFKLSSAYENQRQIIRMVCSGIIVGLIVLAYQLFVSKIINYPYLLLGFGIGISIMSMYYIMGRTDVFSEISKIPFIGGKLAMATLVLTAISGGPILYFLYKIGMQLKSNYLKSRQ